MFLPVDKRGDGRKNKHGSMGIFSGGSRAPCTHAHRQGTARDYTFFEVFTGSTGPRNSALLGTVQCNTRIGHPAPAASRASIAPPTVLSSPLAGVIFPRRNHVRAPRRPAARVLAAAAAGAPRRAGRAPLLRRPPHARGGGGAMRPGGLGRRRDARSAAQATSRGRPPWRGVASRGSQVTKPACRCARACMPRCLCAPAAAQPNYSVASSFFSRASQWHARVHESWRQGTAAGEHPPRSAACRALTLASCWPGA
jgi:hypothetical protein